jgi:naphtho-gamma-pyrone polyketide synthase
MISTHPDNSGETVELLLFGDLAASFEDELRGLLHISDNEALQAFFERTAFSLREELGRHPPAVQNLFPRFNTIIDLVSKLGDTEGTPVLRFCLLTVCQLAKFMQ